MNEDIVQQQRNRYREGPEENLRYKKGGLDA